MDEARDEAEHDGLLVVAAGRDLDKGFDGVVEVAAIEMLCVIEWIPKAIR